MRHLGRRHYTSDTSNTNTCLNDCMRACQHVSMSICLSAWMSNSLSFFLLVWLSACLTAYFPICLAACLSACLRPCLLVCLSARLLTRLSACLPACCGLLMCLSYHSLFLSFYRFPISYYPPLFFFSFLYISFSFPQHTAHNILFLILCLTPSVPDRQSCPNNPHKSPSMCVRNASCHMIHNNCA